MLISEPINLRLELVWLLLLDHPLVPLSDLFDFGQAGVRETISCHSYLDKRSVFVQSLKENGLDVLGEEIIHEFDV